MTPQHSPRCEHCGRMQRDCDADPCEAMAIPFDDDLDVIDGGPPCGHSACSQLYIDTGSRECVFDPALDDVFEPRPNVDTTRKRLP